MIKLETGRDLIMAGALRKQVSPSGWKGRVARQLVAAELPIVAAAALAALFSARLLVLAPGLAAAFWLLRRLALGRWTVHTVTGRPLLALVVMLPVTLWATALPELTWPQVYALLNGVAIFYTIANWVDCEFRLGQVWLGLALAGTALSLAAPVIVRWFANAKPFLVPVTIYSRLPLLVNDAIHPNVLAGAMALILPCVMAAIIFPGAISRWWLWLAAALSTMLMLAVLVLTKSRGGLLGTGLGVLVLIALRWRWASLALPMAGLGGALLTWRLGLTRAVDLLAGGAAIPGLDGRLEIWSRAVYMLQDFPFTGIGMGTFNQVAHALYPFFLAGPDADVPHAHNLFLQVGVDLGLPGLAAYLALLGVTAWSLIRVLRAGDPRYRPPAAGLLASLCALCVHGLLDATTWGTRPAILVWAILGLAAALHNLAFPAYAGHKRSHSASPDAIHDN